MAFTKSIKVLSVWPFVDDVQRGSDDERQSRGELAANKYIGRRKLGLDPALMIFFPDCLGNLGNLQDLV